MSFDLGCASFSASTVEFKHQVRDWVDQGCAAPLLSDRPFEQIVGVPRSSSITRSMADKLDTEFGARVNKIRSDSEGWHCYLDNVCSTRYTAKELVLAIPPHQVEELLPCSSSHKAALKNVLMNPQWILMLELDDSVDLSNIQLPSAIKKIVCDSDKPLRESNTNRKNWLIHVSEEWTEQHIEWDKSQVLSTLTDLLKNTVSGELIVHESYVHRWLYSTGCALIKTQKGVLSLSENLYTCGDWLGDRERQNSKPICGVESAYLSALCLAKHLS